MPETMTTPVPAPAPVRPLSGASLGIVQILWANDDLPELTPPIDAATILDEMARLGFEGSQLGSTFPPGQALLDALASRHLRIAENYAGLPCTVDGPTHDALERGRASLAALHAAEGDVLVAALTLAPERIPLAGRAEADGTPRLTASGLERLARLLETLARDARDLGHTLAFHNHLGTFVETPAELDALLAATDPALVGSCLDLGHYLAGGGDPVAALRRYGDRVRHVHLKDVAPDVLRRLRAGDVPGFLDGLRERIFVEVGGGLLDVAGVLSVLAARDYRGWIMVEQDTTWRPPSESAAMSKAVYDFALGEIARGQRPRRG
jgi:inosose dehydratase